MTGIDSWSITPATNATADAGAINWTEGQAPSTVNNTARQMLADTRAAFNDLAWFQYSTGDQGAGNIAVPAVYASSTSFTISGADVTAAYHVGRRLRAIGVSTGTIYGSISVTSYAPTTTTVTAVWDSGSLSNETLVISLSQIPVTGSPVGSVGALKATSLAVNGATLGTNKLAVTGTAAISLGVFVPDGNGLQWGANNFLAGSAALNIAQFTTNGASGPTATSAQGWVAATNNSANLGDPSIGWKNIYSNNALNVISDGRLKTDIADLATGTPLIKSLRPRSFRFIEGNRIVRRGADNKVVKDENGNDIYDIFPGIRLHHGFIAQEVKGALDKNGIENWAGWCLANKDDPESTQFLRPEMLIASLIKAFQELEGRITALEKS